MKQKRVGILRGGKGKNHRTSIKEGGDLIVYILENLGEKYKPVDIFIDQEDIWHLAGLPIMPAELIHKVDLVWNVAHPSYASILQNFSIPYIGQPPFYSVFIENDALFRDHLKKVGANMARYINAPKNAREVFEKFPAPWLVKTPNSLFVAKTFDELARLINEDAGQDFIVEEFILGKPSAIHTITGFRGEGVYVLPPGNFSKAEKEKIAKFAKDFHKHLGAGQYLKTDFTLHPRRGFFITNLAYTPDLRANSHLEESLHSVGAKTHHLVEHLLEKALS